MVTYRHGYGRITAKGYDFYFCPLLLSLWTESYGLPAGESFRPEEMLCLECFHEPRVPLRRARSVPKVVSSANHGLRDDNNRAAKLTTAFVQLFKISPPVTAKITYAYHPLPHPRVSCLFIQSVESLRLAYQSSEELPALHS